MSNENREFSSDSGAIRREFLKTSALGSVLIMLAPHAAALLEECAAPTSAAPWCCSPPRIMTVMDYQAVVAQAREKNATPAEIVFWADIRRDSENREWYQANLKPRTTKRRAIPPGCDLVFESKLWVRALAKRNISGPGLGEQNKPGDVVEFPKLHDAWQMVEASAMAPL